MQPGSTIFVPKQQEEIKTGAHMIYVMGEVAKPGAYESKNIASPGRFGMDVHRSLPGSSTNYFGRCYAGYNTV